MWESNNAFANRSGRAVCGRLLAEIVGMSHTGGMDVCLLCVVTYWILRRADRSYRGFLPTVVNRSV